MNILKTASVAIICGLAIVSAASLSAHGAMTGSGAINADVVSASDPGPTLNVEHNWLQPSAANRRPQSTTCKSGRIFSQHDVVGDPESCIMQGAGLTVGSYGIVTSPAL
jgi:hypothetical protein